jgi:hypothetical protein
VSFRGDCRKSCDWTTTGLGDVEEGDKAGGAGQKACPSRCEYHGGRRLVCFCCGRYELIGGYYGGSGVEDIGEACRMVTNGG